MDREDAAPYPGWPAVTYDEDWGSEHGTRVEVDVDEFERGLCVVLAATQRDDETIAELSPEKARRLGQDLIDAANEVERRTRPRGTA